MEMKHSKFSSNKPNDAKCTFKDNIEKAEI